MIDKTRREWTTPEITDLDTNTDDVALNPGAANDGGDIGASTS